MARRLSQNEFFRKSPYSSRRIVLEATNLFRGDYFIFVATNLEWIDSFSGRRLFIKQRNILNETNTTARNLDVGSTTADKRSSGEFIGQVTRGVVGVVSAKRNAYV